MDDHYHFQHKRISKRSIYPSFQHHEALLKHPQVIFLVTFIIKFILYYITFVNLS